MENNNRNKRRIPQQEDGGDLPTPQSTTSSSTKRPRLGSQKGEDNDEAAQKMSANETENESRDERPLAPALLDYLLPGGHKRYRPRAEWYTTRRELARLRQEQRKKYQKQNLAQETEKQDRKEQETLGSGEHDQESRLPRGSLRLRAPLDQEQPQEEQQPRQQEQENQVADIPEPPRRQLLLRALLSSSNRRLSWGVPVVERFDDNMDVASALAQAIPLLASANATENQQDQQPAAVFGPEQDSALHIAIRAGSEGAAFELLDLGIAINVKNLKHVTPLILASQKGMLPVVQNLLKRGANLHVLSQRRSSSGSNALLQASHFGYVAIVEALLDAGADIDRANLKRTTPLMRASQEGHADVVRLLISRGANVNCRNQEQMSALMLASQRGHAKVVQMLVKASADINAMTGQRSTSLFLACKRGYLPVAKILVESGAELFYRDTRGRTAGDMAHRHHSPELLTLLEPSTQLKLMKRAARVERNHVMKLMWNLLQFERAFVPFSSTFQCPIHELPSEASPHYQGMSRSDRALIQAMTLPERMIEMVASYMPLEPHWDKNLELIRNRCRVDGHAAVMSTFDLIDEVLEEGGFTEACEMANVKPPLHFDSWSSWKSFGRRHNNLDPKMVVVQRNRASRFGALTASLPGLPCNSLSPNHEDSRKRRFPLEPSCATQMRRDACFLQILANGSSSLASILSKSPFSMPSQIIEQLITVNDIQSVVRRLGPRGVKCDEFVAAELAVLADSLVTWFRRERANFV